MGEGNLQKTWKDTQHTRRAGMTIPIRLASLRLARTLTTM
jgi:hypothetical protein